MVYKSDTIEIIKTIEKIVEVAATPIIKTIYIHAEDDEVFDIHYGDFDEFAEFTELPDIAVHIKNNIEMAKKRKYSRSLSDDSSTFKYMVTTN